MDKKSIIENLIKKNIYTSEQKHLLKAIEKAREEINIAREYFNAVNDPRLVDYAIFREEAAKSRYMYLLNEARKTNLKVECVSMLKELSAG